MTQEQREDETEGPILMKLLRSFLRNFGLTFVVAFTLTVMGASWEQILVVMGIVYGWGQFVQIGNAD